MDEGDRRRLTRAMETALVWAYDHGVGSDTIGVWLYHGRIEARFEGDEPVLEIEDLRDFFEDDGYELLDNLARDEFEEMIQEVATNWVDEYGEDALEDARDRLARKRERRMHR